jgi:hypothetical protein
MVDYQQAAGIRATVIALTAVFIGLDVRVFWQLISQSPRAVSVSPPVITASVIIFICVAVAALKGRPAFLATTVTMDVTSSFSIHKAVARTTSPASSRRARLDVRPLLLVSRIQVYVVVACSSSSTVALPSVINAYRALSRV